MKRILLIVCLSFVIMSLNAQEDKTYEDLSELSLEELLNIPITVSSKTALTSRESPGIISVVTEEEIKNSGARDLIDVLNLIPGINFGFDVQGTVGIGSRGNWGHEGKILLLIDGQEQNELCYSTLQFGNHYNIDQIKRIEIIRGPGSSIYGGYAELGVINIITKSGADINGFSLKGTYGLMSKNFARRNFNYAGGYKFNDFEFDIKGMFGEGRRSDQVFTDLYGDTYDLSKDGSLLNPANINIGADYKGLKVKYIYDYFDESTVSFFDAVMDHRYGMYFTSSYGEIKYDWKLSDKLTITPKYNFIKQKPWNSYDTTALPYDVDVLKNVGSISLSYNFNENINVIGGAEYYDVNSKINMDGTDDTFFNGKNTFNFNNLSFYIQGLIKTKYANFTVGGRVDNNSEIDPAFSPRVGITKVLDRFHFKLLYSNAFRAPGIENMNVAYKKVGNTFVETAPEIKPEKTSVLEVEAGYKLNRKSILTANVYYIKIKDPIIYFYDVATDAEGYYNADQSGTKGFEVEYKIRDKWGYLTANYSYYSAKDLNKVDDYSVPGEDNVLLSAPQHKLTLNSNVKIGEHFSVNPSLIYMSKRYGYDSYNEIDDDLNIAEFDPTALLNIYLDYDNLLTEGLNFGVGVYDLLDQKPKFIEPYKGGWHAPFPGPSREIVVRLSYNFKMK